MTTMDRRSLLKGGAALGLGAAFVGTNAAQGAAPLGQAQILVGFPAGGPADFVCRLFADQLRGRYASTVIVDNRPGAGGRIAIEQAKRAPADGTTLLLTPGSMLTLYPHVYKTLSYDPFKDLTPVTKVADLTIVVSVGPRVPRSVETLPQFLAWCKANPALADFGAPGPGTALHFVGATLGKATGTPLTYVPYRGGPPAINDLLGSHVSSLVVTLGDVMPQFQNGLRVLAVASPTRSTLLPDVPTLAEQGIADIKAPDWFAFLLPPEAAPEVVSHASASLAAASTHPDVVKGMLTLAMRSSSGTPGDLARDMRETHDYWQGVVRSLGYAATD